MNLIDPFQFRDMFRDARSLAVVGNAPSILSWENGGRIDGHDLVVRFNRARTAGLESKIGGRTDVLFVNASNSRQKAPPPAELCRPRCVICFVSPFGSREFDVEPFRDWIGDEPVLLSFGPDLIGLTGLPRGKPLTSGTYAMFTLLRLFAIERLFVTGFTMFGAVAGGVGKYWNEAMPNAATAHDLDQEGRLFCELLSQFKGELAVTEEVGNLLGQHGVEVASGQSMPSGKLARVSLKRRIAEGLSWRLLAAGMALRRSSQS